MWLCLGLVEQLGRGMMDVFGQLDWCAVAHTRAASVGSSPGYMTIASLMTEASLQKTRKYLPRHNFNE